MFSKVLWAVLFFILSQRMEQRFFCALGCDVLRFASMNRIVLSNRWSDSHRIKESNPWIIQKDHFLFLFERSTSLSELGQKATLHFFGSQHSASCLKILFISYFYRCVHVQIRQRWRIVVMFVNNSLSNVMEKKLQFYLSSCTVGTTISGINNWTSSLEKCVRLLTSKVF